MVLVAAHRGASEEFAEHTPAALLRAIDLGADAIEVDVRLTLDNQVVLVHDASTKRTANVNERVSRSTLEQLRQLDFGSWHPATAADPDATISSEQRRSIMTLEDVLALLEAQPRDVGLLVETKHPSGNGKSLEPYVARVFQRFGWNKKRPPGAPPVAVMSFSRAALKRMYACDASIERTLLLRTPVVGNSTPDLPPYVDSIGPGVHLLRRNTAWIAAAVAAGRPAYVWTVDAETDLERALKVGAAVVISNRPRWALDRLG